MKNVRNGIMRPFRLTLLMLKFGFALLMIKKTVKKYHMIDLIIDM